MNFLNLMLEEKKFWIVIFLLVVIVILNLFSNKLVNLAVESHCEKIADAVVVKLQKEYCPSPYGPGIDPDKIDLDKFLKNK